MPDIVFLCAVVSSLSSASVLRLGLAADGSSPTVFYSPMEVQDHGHQRMSPCDTLACKFSFTAQPQAGQCKCAGLM
jgi:hypothetical protein